MNILYQLALSIRLGFATNSSSTHSILLVSPDNAKALRAQLAQNTGPWSQPERGRYGWEWFAIADRTGKLDYLWTNLYMQVAGLFAPKTWIPHTLNDVLGPLPDADASSRMVATAFATAVLEHRPAAPFDDDDGPHIDHDSVFSFPLDPETQLPHVAFARWFVLRVLDDNAVIFGGNDNESGPSMPGRDVRDPLSDDEGAHAMTCYDREDHWLLWQPENGTKLRVPKVDGTVIAHSNVPELIDLKITDKCGIGCQFCYQDSTPAGLHAALDTYRIQALVKHLGVREVAIGGGEPTEYPALWDLISVLAPVVTVNLTTRRPDLIPTWQLAKIGGVGFSTESPDIARRMLTRLGLFEANAYENPWMRKLVIHVVLGATPVADLVAICGVAKQAGVEVLVLAYKHDGRGATFQPHPHDDWIEALRAVFWTASTTGGYWAGPKLGADTPTIERWGPALSARLRVSPKLMSPGEGKFSLYVDAVTRTFARASYGEKRIPFASVDGVPSYKQDEPIANSILTTFRGWHA
jgi:hypothetical protein